MNELRIIRMRLNETERRLLICEYALNETLDFLDVIDAEPGIPELKEKIRKALNYDDR